MIFASNICEALSSPVSILIKYDQSEACDVSVKRNKVGCLNRFSRNRIKILDALILLTLLLYITSRYAFIDSIFDMSDIIEI